MHVCMGMCHFQSHSNWVSLLDIPDTFFFFFRSISFLFYYFLFSPLRSFFFFFSVPVINNAVIILRAGIMRLEMYYRPGTNEKEMAISANDSFFAIAAPEKGCRRYLSKKRMMLIENVWNIIGIFCV